MQSATPNVTGTAEVGRASDSEPVVFVNPQSEADEGAIAQFKEYLGQTYKAAQGAAAKTMVDPHSYDEHIDDAVAQAPGESVAANLASGAVMLLITLMIVLLAALVGGQFADAIPSDSPFSDSIATTTDNAGTAFTIFGVSLLAIPTVSVLAYIVMKLGPFIGFGGGGGSLMTRR